MLPKAQVSHHTPGRTRLRIPERKHDVVFLTATGRRLAVIPGIERATVNKTTGSILLEHQPQLSLEKLRREGEDRSLFAIEEVPPVEEVSQLFAEGLDRWTRIADQELRTLTDGRVDFRTVIAGALFGLSVFQFQRKHFLPAGLMLAIMGMEALRSRG